MKSICTCQAGDLHGTKRQRRVYKIWFGCRSCWVSGAIAVVRGFIVFVLQIDKVLYIKDENYS